MRRAALALLLCVNGCAHGRAASDGCAVFSPIRPSAADVAAMSDRLALQILVHDETGQKVCGWKP